ncbi:GSCOCG00001664001-RA-CDS [Cotesia congregata]|nr:GSCOCG00001664001-RA-CDS [Cotesia congregata]
MNFASVFNNLTKSISPLLNKTPGVVIQQTRNTFVLKRQYKLPLLEKGAQIKNWKNRYFIYQLVENRNNRKREQIDVILKTFVEGMGVRGDKLSLSPYYAYKHLLLPGLAAYATPENIKKFQEDIGVPQQAYSSPFVPQTIRLLGEFLLQVNMSADNPWTLATEHVWSAFRENKIHMSRDSVTLPERPINGPNLEMENKEFYVTVTINQREKINVRCRIRYRSNDPNKLMPDPDALLKRSEPIYPEFKAVLDAIPVHSQLKQKLQQDSTHEQEDQKIKYRRQRKKIIDKSKIYCPHAYLILSFSDILNSNQKLRYRRYYLRKVSPNEPDVIILQDIKNLVLYLLTTPVSLQFINFFHLRIVDRLLRALIIYFQSYTQIWEEEIIKKRTPVTKKARNQLAKGSRLKKAEEMSTLRSIVAREYCELLVGCEESAKYHHMLAGSSIESHGEKDLRIFEVFIQVAHRVVWIALQRKYYNLIEVELHRLLRTDAYNIADRKTGYETNKGMDEEEKFILHGSEMLPRRKLLINSPLSYQLLNEFNDYRLVSLGLINSESKDPRINYLKNALLADEENIQKLRVKVGILGHQRANYDITLVPIDGENELDREELWERRRSSLSDKRRKSLSLEQEPLELRDFGDDLELSDVYDLSKVQVVEGKYDKYREEARKKWIKRELNRQSYSSYSDAISIITTTD